MDAKWDRHNARLAELKQLIAAYNEQYGQTKK